MIEKFNLCAQALPTLPVPHDAVIRRVFMEGEHLVFQFEEGIAVHDMVARIHPNARSLVIRYHLLEPEYDYYKSFNKAGKWGYLLKKPEKLLRLAVRGNKVTYLDHYVSYASLIVVLFKGHTYRRVEMTADEVEYEWLE